MVDRCISCGLYEPNLGNYICQDCIKKGRLLMKDCNLLIYEVNSKVIVIGSLTKEQCKTVIHILERTVNTNV